MNITKKLDENDLTISLEGRLDTVTVQDLEKELEGIDNTKNIVFDFENLEYISSAGLRIVLKTKKENEKVKVINCNPEVYEIFKMTGFAEIMDVEKALRKISIEDCEIIGEGFFGTVYRLDPETIVKVYKNSSIESIKREIDLARKAFVLGIPTAIPYDIVRVGNQYGAVFELINSKSLQRIIVEGADIESIVKELVKVLKQMHSTKVENDELPNKKKSIIEKVSQCKEYLPKEASEKLMKLIFEIPMTNTMIHGDFQIKNIMKQNDDIILIDMDTLAFGHPIFELGAMYATYSAFACVDKNNTMDFLGISLEQSKRILDLTFEYYFEGKPQKYIEEVKYKASIIAFLQVLELRTKYGDKNNEITKQEIEFAKNYLVENLPKIDKLYF